MTDDMISKKVAASEMLRWLSTYKVVMIFNLFVGIGAYAFSFLNMASAWVFILATGAYNAFYYKKIAEQEKTLKDKYGDM